MSEAKHTRAPLEVAIAEIDGSTMTGLHWAVKAVGPSQEAICITGFFKEGGPEEERSIADAHLFSAAHLLLEKLENALPILDDAHQDAVQRGHSDPHWQGVAESLRLQCEAAREAINQAKGIEA